MDDVRGVNSFVERGEKRRGEAEGSSGTIGRDQLVHAAEFSSEIHKPMSRYRASGSSQVTQT